MALLTAMKVQDKKIEMSALALDYQESTHGAQTGEMADKAHG